MDPSDELAIRNLIARVARLTDQWRVESDLTSQYVEDAVWTIEGTEPYHGHAGIIRRMREMRDAKICGPGSTMRHILSTAEVIADPTTREEATVHSFFIMGDMTAGSAKIAGYGQYTDRVRKQDGQWRMASRHCVAFW
ncbi:SnoaL-like domain-containing protein [Sphingobium faniae]|nr:SnoaL-like domain-containing protein [Sphingobium faniae]